MKKIILGVFIAGNFLLVKMDNSFAGGVTELANSQFIQHGKSAGMNAYMAWEFGSKGPWGWFVAVPAAANAALDVYNMFGAKKTCQQAGGSCGNYSGGNYPPYPSIPPFPPYPGSDGTDGFDPNDYPEFNPDGNLPPDTVFNPDKMKRIVDRMQESMKRKGYEALPNGDVKTPKGVIKASMLGSGKALADAGFIDASQIPAYDNAMKEAQNRFKMINAAAPVGGYAGNPRPGKMKFDDAPAFDPSMYGQKEEPKAAATSGLSKNFGNDPVGIATDDLFQMVHRRYRSLDDKNTFVEK